MSQQRDSKREGCTDRNRRVIEWLEDEDNWTYEGPCGPMFNLKDDEGAEYPCEDWNYKSAKWPEPHAHDDIELSDDDDW